MAKTKKVLLRIAKIRRCSAEEASKFYQQIRSVCGTQLSGTSIAQAVEQLEAERKQYALQEVAQLAAELHKVELKQRQVELKQRQQVKQRDELPSNLPPYIVHSDGTVTRSHVLRDDEIL